MREFDLTTEPLKQAIMADREITVYELDGVIHITIGVCDG